VVSSFLIILCPIKLAQLYESANSPTTSTLTTLKTVIVETAVPATTPAPKVTVAVKPVSLPKNTSLVWTAITNQFKLDHHAQSPRVQAEIRKLLADHRFTHILKASAPYIYYIQQQTVAKRLPSELALIPVIESEFNPNDRSTKGAAGLWQLMRDTAKGLGIKIRPGYDGRRNLIASTKGALAYFNDLGHSFKGNWLLAIAAYNCGEGRVLHAEKRKHSSDFWSLSLPKETQYYVPRLLAVAEIIQHPAKYGITLPAIKSHPYFAEVKIKKTIPLTKVAKSSGIDLDLLKHLNPDLKSGLTIAKTVSLLVPMDKISDFKSQFSNVII